MKNPLPAEIYEFDDFQIDVGKRLLRCSNGEIPLTPKVFDTLLYLVRSNGKVIEKAELMREIWSDSIVEENNLTQNISILRRVFSEKPGEQRFIVTVAGHGYRFVPEVRKIDDSISDEPIDAVSDTMESSSLLPPETPRLHGRRKWLVVGTILGSLGLGVAATYSWIADKRSVADPIKTVAVLPFKPLVVENGNEALELGMADTLISRLSNEDLTVRPLSAIRKYAAADQDALSAGRELGVDSVLDGTIQIWGERIRVSAKLLRVADGRQLWSGQFDERFTDIFTVQDAISEKAAAALKIRLSGRKRATENFEAYQLYLKGRYNFTKGAPPDLIASIPFFEEAIEIDPGYALAYAGLAGAYGVLGLSGDATIPDALLKARTAERKALELDNTLGEAQIANCMGIFWYDWDWHSAERACAKAIEIDPNNSDFHGHFAMVLSNTGRHEEALAEAKLSRELNPLNLMQNALEGQFLLHAGRVDEALERLKKTSELEPNFWMPHYIAASAYIEKGMYAEALAESSREYELSGGNVVPFGVYALARSGKRDEARAGLNKLLRSSPSKHVSAYNVALVYNSLDETDSALEWLEQAYEQRDPKMTFLKVEPKWNNLRDQPRFVDLMRRMKFD